jgi:hypothetical protein
MVRNVAIVLLRRRIISLPPLPPTTRRTFHHTSYYQFRYRMSQSQPSEQTVLRWNEERTVAIAAVRRACIVTQKVFETLVKTDFMTKDDSSPVTGVYCSLLLVMMLSCKPWR